MPTFCVRHILLWSRQSDQRKKYVYEERVTLWNAPTIEEAIDLAEHEAEEYAGTTAKSCGLLQGFWLSDEIALEEQGIEVFSLLRESDLAPKAYLSAFFDTGSEKQGEYSGVPKPRSNRRPAARKIRKRPRR